MNSRLIRVLLLVIAIAIGVAASYLLETIETRLMGDRAGADSLRNRASTLSATLSNVRTGQVAYVARGQGEAYWMTRVSNLLPSLDQQLADFQAALSSTAAQADLEPAAAAIDNLHKLDARAQDYVKSGDPLLASDLIFSDGLEAVGTAATHIETAVRTDLQMREAGFGALRRRELMILGGGAGGLLLVVMLLGLTGAQNGSAPVSVPQADEVGNGAEPAAPALSPNLKIAAQVCTDLARVAEGRQLPGLLACAARVIDASGIIVWVADSDGMELRPVMSFGYSDQAMTRMGSISREATNAVAAAYRSATMRIVSGDGFTRGALVAPLLTADGCIGVLSAEMKGGSEKDDSSQALASIFAAQLATLVSSPASAALNKTAAQA